MKKTLEDELMSLAHKILRLRGKEDLEQMKKASAELYEKLSILSFAEKHFSEPEPTINYREVVQAVSNQDISEKTEELKSSAPEEDLDIAQAEIAEPTAKSHPEEKMVEKTDSTPSKMESDDLPMEEEKAEEITQTSSTIEEKHEFPKEEKTEESFEIDSEVEEEINLSTLETKDEFLSSEIDLREISVHFDDLPQFEPIEETEESVRAEEIETKETIPAEESEDVKSTEIFEREETKPSIEKPKQQTETEKVKSAEHISSLGDLFSANTKTKNRNEISPPRKSLNESLKIGLSFGLNDRLAFIQHLFEGKAEDFNRVISQLNSFEKYSEAREFIEEQVKPDYNWEDKTLYEERFFQALEMRMEE